MMQFDSYFSDELKPPNLYSQVSAVFFYQVFVK